MADSGDFFSETPTTKIHSAGLDLSIEDLKKSCSVLSDAFDKEVALHGRSHEIKALTPVFEDFQDKIADKLTVVINSAAIEEQTPVQRVMFVKHIAQLKGSLEDLDQVHELLKQVDPEGKGPLSLALDEFEANLHHLLDALDVQMQPMLAEGRASVPWL